MGPPFTKSALFYFWSGRGVRLANLYTAFPEAWDYGSSFMAPGMIYVIYKTLKAVLYSTASVARCQLVTLAFTGQPRLIQSIFIDARKLLTLLWSKIQVPESCNAVTKYPRQPRTSNLKCPPARWGNASGEKFSPGFRRPLELSRPQLRSWCCSWKKLGLCFQCLKKLFGKFILP